MTFPITPEQQENTLEGKLSFAIEKNQDNVNEAHHKHHNSPYQFISFIMKTNLIRQIPLIKEQPVTEGFLPPKHQETFDDGVEGAKDQGHAEGDGGAWLQSHKINAVFVVGCLCSGQ